MATDSDSDAGSANYDSGSGGHEAGGYEAESRERSRAAYFEAAVTDDREAFVVPAQGTKARLSPINQRRLANFKANRRGYWSLWIFLVLFVMAMLAEFLTNDRPILVSYKGELLAPVFIDYPEEKFGGFLAITDYRDPFIQEEIEADGWMLWPPVRYSYRTVNNEIPVPAPAPPSWMMDKEKRCSRYALGVDDPNCVIGNWNWLGTDDQGRDVLARLVLALLIVGAHGGSGDVRVFYECVSSVSTFLWAFVRVLHVLHPQFHNSRCSTTTADTITAGLDGGDYDGGDDDNNDNNSGGRAIFRNVKQSNNSCSRVTSRRQYYIR